MIVRDEERTLGRALDSVAGLAAELVVVDTGSVDGSVALARGLGARVIEMPWQDNFAVARNTSLDAATGEWILVLDADEWLLPESLAVMRPLLGETRADGLRVMQRNLSPPGELVAYEDCPTTRLFRRRADHRYEGAIHEQIAPAIERAGGTVDDSDIVLMHDGYASTDAEAATRRAARNLALLDKVLATHPEDPYLLYQAGLTLKATGDADGAESALAAALALGTEQLAPYVQEQAHLKRAQLALGRNAKEAAAAHARECLARNEDNVLALYVLGIALVDSGQLVEAFRCFSRLRASPLVRDAHRADVEAVVTFLRNKLKGRA